MMTEIKIKRCRKKDNATEEGRTDRPITAIQITNRDQVNRCRH